MGKYPAREEGGLDYLRGAGFAVGRDLSGDHHGPRARIAQVDIVKYPKLALEVTVPS